MRVVCAPDSFKESMTAAVAAAAMARGVRAVRPDADVVERPLADGGEGLLDAVAGSLGADSTEGKDTCDPLLGLGRRPATRGDGRETPSGERRERSAKRRPSPPGEDAYALDEGIMSELDAQTLIQGVVMSEILKRPNERKWGWR